MAVERYTNLAQSTLDGSIDDSVTSLGVVDAGSFPSAGNFRLLIDSEILLCTGVSSNTFTVTRGVEGTTPASHTSGATVTSILTAGALDNILAEASPLSVCEGRLTLESGVPVSTADQTAKTTLYYTPYQGNRIALYDGAKWVTRIFAELSIAVPSELFRLYDVYAYDNAGVAALELTPWDATQQIDHVSSTSDTTPVRLQFDPGITWNDDDLVGMADSANTSLNDRIWTIDSISSTTLDLLGSIAGGTSSSGDFYLVPLSRSTGQALQNGVLVKSGAATRRFLGSFMTTGVAGQTQDSITRRFVSNYYHRVRRLLRKYEATASWSYATATARPANALITNRVEVVTCHPEIVVELTLAARGLTTADGTLYAYPSEDHISASPHAEVASPFAAFLANTPATFTAFWHRRPTAGYHYYLWTEQGAGSGTNTHYGTNRGITGIVEA